MEKNGFPMGVFVHEACKDWTLQYNEDGSYIFRVNDQVDAIGTYTIQITCTLRILNIFLASSAKQRHTHGLRRPWG